MRLFLSILFIAVVFSVFSADNCFAREENDNQKESLLLDREAEIIPVSFITLRNKTNSSDPSKYFGGNRGQLRAGICSVSFSPIWGLGDIADSAPFYIPDEMIKLTEIRETPLENFFKEIGSFSQSDNGNIVLYIHGYNIDFEKNCRRTAIFQRALGLHDRLLLFSWPADGNMFKYTWDEADLAWSVPHMVQVFEELVKRTGDRKIDIVAHSLGARGAVQALVRMAYREREAHMINELVLIAPDIDTDIFRQELPFLKRISDRITVYVSNNDKALRLSQEVHGYARLGQAGENLVVHDGVESIDISAISTRRISGHLYHLFSPEVISDLTRLLHSGETASLRPSLKISHQYGLPYWRMLPD
jgi:esterase/lipase superfamily enzyme